MTHTPTPWSIDWSGVNRDEPVIVSDTKDCEGDKLNVADLHHGGYTYEHEGFTAEDNAKFIVRAVNTHAALRDALRDLLAWVDEEDDNREGTLRELHAHCNECTQGQTPVNFDKGPCVYHKARAALAQCGGE